MHYVTTNFFFGLAKAVLFKCDYVNLKKKFLQFHKIYTNNMNTFYVQEF